ncbi:hypothetical protein [Cupriavidus pinatubonensis]|uniref:Porin n=1 Tax=Cupriavidus pinatubonensis TaxID=248026 RepID=A0ABN7YKH8_9BURK|nr:hypothetical protein [Cupriavidus pinatubonensis]CAG9174004.1 hypothetical protein LMG23994_02763 [Cupriavidus pinatubonensis]
MKSQRKMLAVMSAAGSLAAGAASAQSNVQLYGTVDAFVGSVRASGDAHSTAAVESSGLTTSY